QAELDQVGEDFIALALEMVLGSPQHVEAEFIHELRDLARGVESFAQARVGIAPFICWRPLQADIFKFYLTDIQNVEFSDHAGPRRGPDRMTVASKAALRQVSLGLGSDTISKVA